jgi:hypothetical protein
MVHHGQKVDQSLTSGTSSTENIVGPSSRSTKYAQRYFTHYRPLAGCHQVLIGRAAQQHLTNEAQPLAARVGRSKATPWL